MYLFTLIIQYLHIYTIKLYLNFRGRQHGRRNELVVWTQYPVGSRFKGQFLTEYIDFHYTVLPLYCGAFFLNSFLFDLLFGC